ncbi:hypothetical protein [Mangrovibacterium sp.]|uniref:hypothetical protein n=1 Tax=Mangrovibacterium sp. TaxID=1961364 RepID=UPI0035625D01
MKFSFATLLCFFTVLFAVAQQPSEVFIDKKGVMRWSDSKQEASFFGVNYTLPFAHAYRAAGYLGVDRKKAIDDDVYHFARLGFNAYRVHIWDVEISDAQGNLIANDHLDLLDYLISKLKERGISIVITAQTNFGNGYPERNQPTGGFSYLYDKCDIHSKPEAIAAQENYISALVQHVNPYTGNAYKDEAAVVGFEINNEPCHSGTVAETRDYINRMLLALKQAGNSKPVFYNVSHNRQVAAAYFDTDIQGTTYQWYPSGLVSGYTRQGNFLTYVDEYPIPFSELKGFSNKAKLVYEFDPADLLYSYMYPATVRSFRTAGFQWITQFAYDPLELAAHNTEYQTHYLNLAYTPGKAISLKIAAEAARQLPMYKSYGTYPVDTVFGEFRVSAKQNLSELNSYTRFYYSNSTSTQPKQADQLEAIAGVGRSQLVHYEGSGAYFLDKLEDGVWRLEVMPDAVPVSDPFSKPSLDKDVVRIYSGSRDMTLQLPNLGNAFQITAMNAGNQFEARSENGTIEQLKPGVYLLQKSGIHPAKSWTPESSWNNIRLGEYVAPTASDKLTVYHQPAKLAETGKAIQIEAIIAAPVQPDSVLIYTDRVSFWNDHNTYFKMKREQGYNYAAEIPAESFHGNALNYNLVVFSGANKTTFPGATDCSPLDWDYTAGSFYSTKLVAPDSPLILFDAEKDAQRLESYVLPEWSSIRRESVDHGPGEKSSLRISFKSDDAEPKFYLRRYIGDLIVNRPAFASQAKYLCIQAQAAPAGLMAGLVTSDGFTYAALCLKADNGIIRLPLSQLQQTKTALLPNAYPVFMPRYFEPKTAIPFSNQNSESLVLWIDGQKGESRTLELSTIWIE